MWKTSAKSTFASVLMMASVVSVIPGGLAAAETPTPQHSAGSGRWQSPFPTNRLVDPVSEQGQNARGLYFNGPILRALGVDGVIRTVQRANMNAAVIDLKDGEGRVLWDTQVEELRPHRRLYVDDMGAVIKKLKEAGIYVIARMVCFSDPNIPRAYPDRAVQDARPRHEGEVWANTGKRNPWLDGYNTKNHDMIVAMAKEAEALGVDEIQFDYFRFPVDVATEFAVWPSATETPRKLVLLGLLRRIDEALSIPIGVDVFGLTAFRRNDQSGLGQGLEEWAEHLEVFSPMLYVNGMGAWMRDGKGQRALRLVSAGVGILRERLGHGPVIRPFLQAFSAGADNYGPGFIAEQIQGARSGGGDGFLFWHPASNYGTVRAGALGPARALFPFPMEERAEWRANAWRDRLLMPPNPANERAAQARRK